MRSLYLEALEYAFKRPAGGDAVAAMRRFLTLNAAYFLGEWVPATLHEPLVRRLAVGLDGLADLDPPDDELQGTLLAQHTRELAAAFEPAPWLARMIDLTRDRVPSRPDAWDAQIDAAIGAVKAGGDGAPLLLAHARRRLWELAHPAPDPPDAAPVPTWALRYAERAATGGDDRSILVAEALLAELAYAPSPAPRRRGRGRGKL